MPAPPRLNADDGSELWRYTIPVPVRGCGCGGACNPVADEVDEDTARPPTSAAFGTLNALRSDADDAEDEAGGRSPRVDPEGRDP